MTVFDWQSLLHPILMVESFFVAVTSLGIFIFVNRSLNIIMAAMVWFIMSMSFLILTLVTGHNPILNIDQIRPLIVWSRGLLAITLLGYLWAQMRRIWQQL